MKLEPPEKYEQFRYHQLTRPDGEIARAEWFKANDSWKIDYMGLWSGIKLFEIGWRYRQPIYEVVEPDKPDTSWVIVTYRDNQIWYWNPRFNYHSSAEGFVSTYDDAVKFATRYDANEVIDGLQLYRCVAEEHGDAALEW